MWWFVYMNPGRNDARRKGPQLTCAPMSLGGSPAIPLGFSLLGFSGSIWPPLMAWALRIEIV